MQYSGERNHKTSTTNSYFTFVFYQVCTVIQEVFADGAVFRDNRLMAGDQILEVGEHICPFYGIHYTIFIFMSCIHQEQ